MASWELKNIIDDRYEVKHVTFKKSQNATIFPMEAMRFKLLRVIAQ